MSRDWLVVETLREATGVQRQIAERVERADRLAAAPTIAGADVSMKWRDSRGPVHAAIAPLEGPATTATAMPNFFMIDSFAA